ncbi:unnamed protein product [Cylicocyclus nassatus]|uniref:Hexosyltransferase n=1 Tax=Cylicocyclus nassatus TaxID=53992 RepID=A0AA36M8Z8_CYLNA|nr:unnamed protein product [Cylicocyclus nassatus]
MYTKLLKLFGYMIILCGILNLFEIMRSRLQLSKKLAAKSSTTYKISFANFTQYYKYILLPSSSTLSSCLGNSGRSPLMIATVLSIANHTEERQAVRETWASERESKFIKTHYVMVFFIISATSKNDLQILQKEQEEYDDLIVTDLHEAFQNLHLKDPFYTGIIAEEAKIRRVHWEASVTLDFRKLKRNKLKEVKIFVHSLHTPEHLRTVFQLMKDIINIFLKLFGYADCHRRIVNNCLFQRLFRGCSA